jgi:uncharacterized protein (TIRG00374 family)
VHSPAPGTAPPAPSVARLRRAFVWSLLLAAALYLALALYGDWRALGDELGRFPFALLPAALGLTLANYAGRLVRWHWYLGLVGVRAGWADSTRVFAAGMTMVMTPGKVGELLKSFMLRRVSGAPVAATAPIVLVERLVDGLAMLVLAGVGLYGAADERLRQTGLALLVVLLAAVVAVQWRPLALAALGLGRRLPLVRRFAAGLETFYESSYTLLRPRHLITGLAIGVVGWACEGLAYYLVLTGVGAPPGLATALDAVFVFSISAIVGAVLATPGGLGGTEGSLVGLGQQLLGLSATSATAAALVIRFATLWFGVGIGLATLALFPSLLDGGAGPVGAGREEPDPR